VIAYFDIVYIGVVLCQVVAGVLLVKGVLQIRSFYNRKQGQLNSKMLCLHATAFVFFLVANIVQLVFVCFVAIRPQNQIALDNYINALIVYFAASFVFQILLMSIFWQLGKADKHKTI
jgi:hypothetical protein